MAQYSASVIDVTPEKRPVVNHEGRPHCAPSNVIPFRFEEKQVRTILIDDQPWFVASDVSEALEYRDANKLTRMLDDDEKGTQIVGTLGGEQQMLVISESGLYSAILRSRKKEAKHFKKWVTAEVLPAIRKHGRYTDENGRMGSLVGAVIGSSGVLVLDRVIEQKASPIAQPLRRSFKHTMKSRLRNRFNVQRTDLIPADQLADACNFIAAYSLEGEWLPKEDVPAKSLNLHYPVSRWLQENPFFAKQQKPIGPGSLLISALMLYGVGSSSPTQALLDELKDAGYNVEACRIEMQAMRYHLERMSDDLGEIQRRCLVGQQAGVKFRVSNEAAA